DEGLFPGEPNASMREPLEVYVDWREDHDPSLPCPKEMALVDGSYCIDRWEGSLVEITAAGEQPFPATHRVEDRLVRAQSRPGVKPQGYISGAEAQRACEMAGKRLCSGWEWWRACAGSKRMIYPYGTMHVARRCNEERPKHPVVELYGDDAGPEIWYVEPMNKPAINELPGTLAVTGARHKCRSDDGIFDMVGNVHEWVNDPAGTFHGGAYSGKIALGCQYVTTAHGFSYHDYSTGFRCCTDPYGIPE
ncbi:MAG: SUMF1/EgtB/PvdO family nonheme iron enzyme, partial [Myxococcota bacterium]